MAKNKGKGKGKQKGYQSNQVSKKSQDGKGHDQMSSTVHEELEESKIAKILQNIAKGKKDEKTLTLETLAAAFAGESAADAKPDFMRGLGPQDQISKLKALYATIENLEADNTSLNESLQNHGKMLEQWLNIDKELGLEKKVLERDEEMVVKITREIQVEQNRNTWIQDELQNLEQTSGCLFATERDWQEAKEKIKKLDILELIKNNVGDIEFKGEQKIEKEAEEVKKLHRQISLMHQLEKILDDVIQVVCERGAQEEFSVGMLKALRLEFEKGHPGTKIMLSECRGELQKEREMVDQLMLEFLYKDVFTFIMKTIRHEHNAGDMDQRKMEDHENGV